MPGDFCRCKHKFVPALAQSLWAWSVGYSVRQFCSVGSRLMSVPWTRMQTASACWAAGLPPHLNFKSVPQTRASEQPPQIGVLGLLEFQAITDTVDLEYRLLLNPRLVPLSQHPKLTGFTITASDTTLHTKHRNRVRQTQDQGFIPTTRASIQSRHQGRLCEPKHHDRCSAVRMHQDVSGAIPQPDRPPRFQHGLH